MTSFTPKVLPFPVTVNNILPSNHKLVLNLFSLCHELWSPPLKAIIKIPRSYLFSTYKKMSRKTNISYPLIGICTCAYQEVRNISSSKNFPYVVNGWLPTENLNRVWPSSSERGEASLKRDGIKHEERF